MGPVTNRLSLTQRLFAASPSVPFLARRWWQPEPKISILWHLTYFSPTQLLSINKAQGNLHFKPRFTKAFCQAEQSCWLFLWFLILSLWWGADPELSSCQRASSSSSSSQHAWSLGLIPSPVPRESLTSHLSLAPWISDCILTPDPDAKFSVRCNSVFYRSELNQILHLDFLSWTTPTSSGSPLTVPGFKST